MRCDAPGAWKRQRGPTSFFNLGMLRFSSSSDYRRQEPGPAPDVRMGATMRLTQARLIPIGQEKGKGQAWQRDLCVPPLQPCATPASIAMMCGQCVQLRGYGLEAFLCSNTLCVSEYIRTYGELARTFAPIE